MLNNSVHEKFLLDNSQRYLELVRRFTPSKTELASDKADHDSLGTDFIIATRIRPLADEDVDAGMPQGVFTRHPPSRLPRNDIHELRRKPIGLPDINSFTFGADKTYGPSDTTEKIYDDLVKPLVPWAWSGGVSTVFAYGQTGSGKTFTVSGIEELVALQLMDGSLPGERKVFISVIELAGNATYDLLNNRKSVAVLEDAFGSTHLSGASEQLVADAPSLLLHLAQAVSFRRTASTVRNDSSSRSHAICRIRIENPALPGSDDGIFYLIDLAGSEAARDIADHSAERIKESKQINTSLSVLKDCIRGRASLDLEGPGPATAKPKRPAYVPFRQSTLTRVLKHLFDPSAHRSCRTVVIACVNASLADVGPSKNTLRYAQMLRVSRPRPPPPVYDAAKPATWTNVNLRDWVKENSGQPPVQASLLAPFESGAQLLRLPVPEFLVRCLATPGVTTEQAEALQAKLWRMHIDSSSATSSSSSTSEPSASALKQAQTIADLDRSTSADPREEMAGVPFHQRIRPGMVVSWDPPLDVPFRMPGRNLVVVLSPRGGGDGSGGDGTDYICAFVGPGLTSGAYEIHLWQQIDVAKDRMLAEVVLEYDPGTRYYHEVI